MHMNLVARITDPFNQTPSPEDLNANWSSWTSQFEPPRINSLQRSTRDLLIHRRAYFKPGPW